MPVGVVVEMDLPELGLTDLAWVMEIADCPEIEAGDGRVVTATFHHSSGDVIDLALGSEPSDRTPPETIGTTSNHPFWSVDRQEYVQAGQLEAGERVLTFSGDTKRVVAKLPRPGPQPVYNLEVHAEHVYFVGEDGVLVHNTYGDSPAARRAYLNGKFGRSGNLHADINARGNVTVPVTNSLGRRARVAHPGLRVGDFDEYRFFNSSPRGGDNLEGHELLQSAWLQRNAAGISRSRLPGSRNPAIALTESAAIQDHTLINRLQEIHTNPFLSTMTARQNIEANIRILRSAQLANPEVLTVSRTGHSLISGC